MKNLTILFLCLTMGNIVFSQTNGPGYPIPEYPNTPFSYDGNTNSLLPLEKLLYTKTNRPTSPVTMESLFYVEGTSSKVRFPSKGTISIIAKLKDTDIDPSEYVMVMKFKVNDHKKRERREYILSTVSPYHSERAKPQIVQCIYKKIGDGLVLLTLNNMEPGEYFVNFESAGNYTYCFGVD